MLKSNDYTYSYLCYVCISLFMFYLFRTFYRRPQTARNTRSHFQTQLEHIQKSSSGTQLSNRSALLHQKGNLLMSLNLFVYKNFGQTEKLFEETGNRSCN